LFLNKLISWTFSNVKLFLSNITSSRWIFYFFIFLYNLNFRDYCKKFRSFKDSHESRVVNSVYYIGFSSCANDFKVKSKLNYNLGVLWPIVVNLYVLSKYVSQFRIFSFGVLGVRSTGVLWFMGWKALVLSRSLHKNLFRVWPIDSSSSIIIV
jgi:hypothetical protein